MRSATEASVHVQPNVTPMIDVMLVLLIIFMMVTPALIDGFPLALPQAVNLKAHPEEPTDHVLGIDARGEYYLDKQRVGASDLRAALASIFSRAEDRVLYVKADKSLDYAKVLDALDVATASGVRVVGMISTQRGQSR